MITDTSSRFAYPHPSFACIMLKQTTDTVFPDN